MNRPLVKPTRPGREGIEWQQDLEGFQTREQLRPAEERISVVTFDLRTDIHAFPQTMSSTVWKQLHSRKSARGGRAGHRVREGQKRATAKNGQTTRASEVETSLIASTDDVTPLYDECNGKYFLRVD